MKIYIKYLSNKNYLINIENYQSINSIINQYIIEQNTNLNGPLNNTFNFSLNDNLDNYFIDYNGQKLNKNYSLEKYKISENSILTLNQRQKGGNNFFSFAASNPITVFIVFIIVLMPLIILPMGFLPMLSSLIKVIIDKGFKTIGQYLVCILGKKTLFSRFSFIISLLKYVIFILLIYVIITFPLVLLCITLKGHNVLDDPNSICKPISTGTTAGIVNAMIYFLIYFMYRGANLIFKPLINIFQQFPITNMLFVPLLKNILYLYDRFKYIPAYSIPLIGQILLAYHSYMDLLIPFVDMFLSYMIQLGCKSINTNFGKGFIKKLTSFGCDQVKKCLEKDGNKEQQGGAKKEDNYEFHAIPDSFCNKEVIQCCNPSNFMKIGDTLMNFLEIPISSDAVKKSGFYSQFLLVVEAIYDGAIKQYCSDSSENLGLNDNSVAQKIIEAKGQIDKLNKYGREFAVKEKTAYFEGETIFKVIFKMIFINIFCNIANTSKSSKDVIVEMNGLTEIVEMIKAGSTSGLFATFCYFLTVIILIFCSIFGVF